jgi:predicted CopG family antitoxin
MQSLCMASTTISVNSEAYKRLKEAKPPGKSFSDVILHYVIPPSRTAGDLLRDLEQIQGQSFIDEELMKKVEARKGKSSRKKRAR